MIKKISLENFLCFRKEEVRFDKNLSILVGPSGGGKTSILEGILFGILGFTYRSLKGTLKNLINENSGSARVILEVLLNNNLCIIERERLPEKTNLKVIIGSREVEGTLGDKFDRIAEVWGYSKKISKTSLLRAIYMTRDFIDEPFPVELEESWIMDLVERIKNLVLSKARELEKKVSEIKGKISSLEGVLKDLEKKKAYRELDKAKVEVSIYNLKKEKEKVDTSIGALKERLRILTESLEKGVCLVCLRPMEGISISLDSLKSEIVDLVKKKEVLENDLKALENLYIEMTGSSLLGEEKEKILKSLSSLGEELMVLSKELEKFEQGKDKVKGLKNLILEYFLKNYIFPMARKYSSYLFLEDVNFRLGDIIEVKIGSGFYREFFRLSTGEKVRVGIALKLASNYSLSNLIKTPFLLMDEVLDSLDLDCCKRLLDILIKERSQIILTSHRPVNILMNLIPSGNLEIFYIDKKVEKIYDG